MFSEIVKFNEFYIDFDLGWNYMHDLLEIHKCYWLHELH